MHPDAPLLAPVHGAVLAPSGAPIGGASAKVVENLNLNLNTNRNQNLNLNLTTWGYVGLFTPVSSGPKPVENFVIIVALVDVRGADDDARCAMGTIR